MVFFGPLHKLSLENFSFFFFVQAGSICSEGNPRIQHLTAASVSPEPGKSRFPKLEECAHFHYEHVELGPLQVIFVNNFIIDYNIFYYIQHIIVKIAIESCFCFKIS